MKFIQPGTLKLGLALLSVVAIPNLAAGAIAIPENEIVPVEIAQSTEEPAQWREFYDKGKRVFDTGVEPAYRIAIIQFEQALQSAREAGATDGVALVSLILGLSHARLDEYQTALTYYEAALEAAQTIGDRDIEATALNNIGTIYDRLSQYDKALDYYNRALPILRDTENRAVEATTLANIGKIYENRGNYSEALDRYNQALSIRQDIGDRKGEGKMFVSIGRIYSYRSHYREALDYYNRALPILREADDLATTIAAQNNIGQVRRRLGHYTEALNRFNQALSIVRGLGDRSGESSILNSIGVVYNQLGNRDEALDYFNQALSIEREIGARDGESLLLHNIGQLHASRENYSKALDYFNRAFAIQQEVGDRNLQATILSNIGAAYRERGDDRKALDYFNRALPMLQAIGNREGEAITLGSIGSVYRERGDDRKALDYYNRALPMLQAIGNRGKQAQVLYHMALTYRDRSEFSTALENIETAIDIVEQLRGDITSPDLRTSYFATVQDFYKLKIDLLMQLHQQNPERGYDIRAFNTSEQTRARTLIELLSEANLEITENADSYLLQQERELQQKLQAIDAERVAQLQQAQTQKQVRDIVETAQRNTEAVLHELDNLALEIRSENPAYAALKYPDVLTLPEIQQRVLDEDTTLLQYSLGDNRSYVWVVTEDGFETHVLPGREKIEAAARGFYASLETPGNLAITVRKAQDLSNLILAPIANRLNSDRLLVVPDGLLHQIPFSAIDTPNTQSYTPLLVNAEIVNAPSSSTIAINRDLMGDRPPAPKRLAVLADPVFTPDDPRVTGSGGERNLPVEIQRNLRAFDLRGIPRLPYTRKEAQQLLDLVPDDSEASVFDFQANYPWVTSDRLDRYQFVHFATHGFVNESNPELSGLILSLVDEQGRPQNGFLRLVDIFNLQMSAELVTLSACQTGLGDNVDGEGVIGLTRGLMYAGAERTLVSLWNVSDRQTATLMSRFYDGIWQDGLAPAAALRQAQLSMWEEGDHPYFWAAFGLQGEWQG